MRSRKRQVLSLRAQETELKRLAIFHKLRIVKVFGESHTAKRPGRPEFNEMINFLRQQPEPTAILAWDADRLLRNKEDETTIVRLIEEGIVPYIRFPTFTYDNSATSKFLLSLQFAHGKFHSDRLSEQIRFGVGQKLIEGGWPGPKPFGYRYDHRIRNIVADPAEAKIVKRLFTEYASGKYSLHSIRALAAELGCCSSTGRPKSLSAIKYLLSNELYIGLMAWKDGLHQGNFKPVIKKDLFEKVRAQLKGIKKNRRTRRKLNFAFCGIFHCSCGGMVTAQFARGHGGLYRYYRCTRKSGRCSEPYIRAENLHTSVVAQLARLKLPQGFRSALDAEFQTQIEASEKEGERYEQQLEAAVTELETKLTNLVSKYVDGSIDDASYLKLKAHLLREKTAKTHQLSHFTDTHSAPWIEPVREFIKTLNRATDCNSNTTEAEIAEILRRVGTNHTISNKLLAFELKPEFQFAAQFLAQLQTGSLAPQAVPTNEIVASTDVCSFLDRARTLFAGQCGDDESRTKSAEDFLAGAPSRNRTRPLRGSPQAVEGENVL